jgi:uncharacterized membrane protein
MALLTRNRQRSVVGSIVGGLAGVAVFAAAYLGLPEVTRPTALAIVLLVPGLAVFLLTLAVAFGRFATERFDPLSNAKDGRYMRVSARALGNTVEQGVAFAALASAMLVAAAPWAPSVAVALAVTFGLARVAFWIGYLRGTFARGPGMAATMLVNLAAAVGAVAALPT